LGSELYFASNPVLHIASRPAETTPTGPEAVEELERFKTMEQNYRSNWEGIHTSKKSKGPTAVLCFHKPAILYAQSLKRGVTDCYWLIPGTETDD